jgi:6-phosphofructokinase
VTKIRPKVNFTIGQPSTPTLTPNDHDPSAKKLSMTAQQYKNSQIKIIKGVVMLSPNIKRRADKASCSDLKAKVALEELRSEQSRSMNCLITLGGEGSFRNAASVITMGSGNRKG